ncbi:response regulator [Psychromicrobium sp. YIM B11713]|uniref:response regulator n=1 Tax=Psychromicrobium sp. YIM B11713 TaxID=3145233 RepID=UPI00374F739E
MTITVVLADDQAMVRAGFAALLNAQQDIEVLGQAENGLEAVEMCAKLHPDVALLDVRMPELNGLEAAAKIIEAGYGTRVLMLTTFDIDDYVYEALAIGASGFLLKDALADELVSGVRVVAAGEALLAPSVTKRLIENFTRSRPRTPRHTARLNNLTDREREVLTLVGQGLSNQEIAAELFIAEQTVKTHVSKVLTKLDLRDRVQAVVLAYDTGLVEPAG